MGENFVKEQKNNSNGIGYFSKIFGLGNSNGVLFISIRFNFKTTDYGLLMAGVLPLLGSSYRCYHDLSINDVTSGRIQTLTNYKL